MKCNYCQAEARAGARYCRKCGKTRSEEAKRPTRETASPASQTSLSSKNHLERPPAFWISIIGVGAILLILVGAAFSSGGKSAAYKDGFDNWNWVVSGAIYVDMKWGGRARMICESYGASAYSGQALRDYTQGCIDGFNNANP